MNIKETTVSVYKIGDYTVYLNGKQITNLYSIQYDREFINVAYSGNLKRIPETIKGTLVFTVFDKSPLVELFVSGEFDLTIVRSTEAGLKCSCTFHNVLIVKEQGGFSVNDLEQSIVLSFTAESIDDWAPIEK
jgi:hypothetical protein